MFSTKSDARETPVAPSHDSLPSDHVTMASIGQEMDNMKNVYSRTAEQASSSPTTSSSSAKPKPKKTLRGDYNPLMGDTSGGACYRPPRRGGATGGG
ncbi:hypothetical protein RRG08_062459 [Elysia crispata]|uniref:Uncharacterized protein n=1 Tax=Elysia crispata TaxID=231223 RepID=A0AAE0XPR2_9GAST|nr:hypothetical protein RRG08_062459 [Elysia crispata]